MAKQPMKPKGNVPTATRNVRFLRPEIRALKEQYDTIRDCIAGEIAVKAAGIKYLPAPNPVDTSTENMTRYTAYRTRAQFYGATGRTLEGLLGQIYAITPLIEVPAGFEEFIADATGGGVSLIQQSISAANNVLAYSRAGILVDYPVAPEVRSLADPKLNPTLTVYQPWQVINWRTVTVGSQVKLSLVVIEEPYEKEDDGFSITTETQWRVLGLDAEGYYVEIWQGQANPTSGSRFYPLDSAGNRLTEIPFRFIGAKNNDSIPDRPLLYDLASLNIGHYRNSADYEEACFICGQPLYVFGGLTKDWVNTVLGGRVETGARASVALPEKGTASVLQVKSNTMPFEAMQHKERQMVALGAKLVEQRSVQRTATESSMDLTTENSILSTAANNVSDGITWAFEQAAKFLGISGTMKFKLNTEFAIQRMSADDLNRIVSAWQAHLISFTEARAPLKNSGYATLTEIAAHAEIDAEIQKKHDLEIEKIEAKKSPPPKPGENPANPAN